MRDEWYSFFASVEDALLRQSRAKGVESESFFFRQSISPIFLFFLAVSRPLFRVNFWFVFDPEHFSFFVSPSFYCDSFYFLSRSLPSSITYSKFEMF